MKETPMADKCCGHDATFEGLDMRYKRILWAVIAINATMFLVETVAGHMAGSQALQADALDFLGDTLTYGLSFWVIGKSVKVRSTAALLKGLSLAAMGAWVMGSTLWQVFVLKVPTAEIMGIMSVLAFAANLTSVLLLMRYKNGDANVRSVWLCSRNDMLGNIAVVAAAIGVFGTASAWPDLLVATLMAGLFLTSATSILKQAWAEYRKGGHR